MSDDESMNNVLPTISLSHGESQSCKVRLRSIVSVLDYQSLSTTRQRPDKALKMFFLMKTLSSFSWKSGGLPVSLGYRGTITEWKFYSVDISWNLVFLTIVYFSWVGTRSMSLEEHRAQIWQPNRVRSSLGLCIWGSHVDTSTNFRQDRWEKGNIAVRTRAPYVVTCNHRSSQWGDSNHQHCCFVARNDRWLLAVAILDVTAIEPRRIVTTQLHSDGGACPGYAVQLSSILAIRCCGEKSYIVSCTSIGVLLMILNPTRFDMY